MELSTKEAKHSPEKKRKEKKDRKNKDSFHGAGKQQSGLGVSLSEATVLSGHIT